MEFLVTTSTATAKPVAPAFDATRTVEYFGVVNYATNERVLEEVRELYQENPDEEIILSITSAGGPSGSAMGFYDHIRYILRPKLITVGSGDVDSSGVILLQAGDTRYVTPHTTMLLHAAGRTFDGNQRYTAHEVEAMLTEDRLKDSLYASIIAERSNGRLSTEQVQELMERTTVLTPSEMLRYGLVDAVLF